jgi:tetratricopeptide (TPR) repeat protein
MGDAYTSIGSLDTAIIIYEWALRIKKDTLGLHPATAATMTNMCVAYCVKGQFKKAIELFEQALRIYERTVGRMHRDAALAIFHMGRAHGHLGEFVKAEELMLEAVDIYTKIFGKEHEETQRARNILNRETTWASWRVGGGRGDLQGDAWPSTREDQTSARQLKRN